jgi:hypothetical protein
VRLSAQVEQLRTEVAFVREALRTNASDQPGNACYEYVNQAWGSPSGLAELRIGKAIVPPSKRNPPDLAPAYGRVCTVADLGRLCRAERARRGLTLAQVYEATGLTTRFLSEFERGKEHASAGRVLRTLQNLGLDVVVLPRSQAERLLRALHRSVPVKAPK